MNIPVMRPRLGTFEEVAPFLQRIDQSHIYSNHGPLTRDLEAAYSAYLKVDKELIVALANATQAIQGLMSISRNNDWIVPDYTFSATGLAVLNANRNLHICDVNLHDWKIDTNLLSNEQKEFGILPVMPFGTAIDFDAYNGFEDVIIDAAASLGATPPSFCQMPKSWAVVYSLHATKVLGAGEGAIVVCGNREQANSLRAWSNFGFLLDRTSVIQGTNAKMSEMSAAYGLYSVANLEIEKADWLKSQEYVASRTSKYTWATYVNSVPQFHPYWIASFKDEEAKKIVAERLLLAGIQSRDWWAKPLSQQKAFTFSKSRTLNGNAKHLSEIHLGLPMYRGLSSNSIEDICDVVQSAISS
jgi:dTDP-4-amino-4,6-dideoxygalactose transaminase